MTTNKEDHPVWTVYDKLRTASLNVKYYSQRLRFFEKLNVGIEFVLAATAPTSAVSGLFFWQTEIGNNVWKIMIVIAAFTAIAKPLLDLTKRIKAYGSILAGYRILEYDLREIKTSIEQKRKYDQSMMNELKKALLREKELIVTTPETCENKKVKRRCEVEVLKEFPALNFYIPED